MANAYSSLHSLTLALAVISTVGVSLWGRWAMFRLRKLGNGTEAAGSLLTKIGFAFRSLAYVPLLLLLVFVPPFLCDGANCQPADFANSGLLVSLILGLIAAVLWVGFVFSRVYTSDAEKLFASLVNRDRILLVSATVAAVLALALMVASA